jgi:hypothetical protein
MRIILPALFPATFVIPAFHPSEAWIPAFLPYCLPALQHD